MIAYLDNKLGNDIKTNSLYLKIFQENNLYGLNSCS